MIDIHRSEEEQVEALKKWWKENGTAVIAGIAIGVALIVGVRYWWTYQERHAQESSRIYSQVLEAKNLGNQEQLQAEIKRLKQDYEGTPYATFGAFLNARAAIKNNDLEKAIEEYQWALDHAPHEALAHLARVRLARLLVDSEQYDRALDAIGEKAKLAFTAQYEELRGDIFEGKGDIVQARNAYQSALALATGKHREIIEMKLHSLAQGATAQDNNATDGSAS